MIIYVGFIMEQGRLLPEFVTEDKKRAEIIARRKLDDALPNNSVQVFEIDLDLIENKPIIIVNWTPEGEHVTTTERPEKK